MHLLACSSREDAQPRREAAIATALCNYWRALERAVRWLLTTRTSLDVARFGTPGRFSQLQPADPPLVLVEALMSSTRLVVCSFLFAACGSDPVQYSAPVGIELKAKSGDVAGNVVSEQKDITTESGNPYGAFINTATTKLNGHAPSRVEIDQMTMTLGAQSTGVTTLDQVLTGDVDVAFLVNDSNNTYDAGHVMNPTGAGPVAMDPGLDWSLVSPADRTKMLGGSFKVSLRGTAATGFQTKGANASLQVTFTFTAFE